MEIRVLWVWVPHEADFISRCRKTLAQQWIHIHHLVLKKKSSKSPEILGINLINFLSRKSWVDIGAKQGFDLGNKDTVSKKLMVNIHCNCTHSLDVKNWLHWRSVFIIMQVCKAWKNCLRTVTHFNIIVAEWIVKFMWTLELPIDDL